MVGKLTSIVFSVLLVSLSSSVAFAQTAAPTPVPTVDPGLKQCRKDHKAAVRAYNRANRSCNTVNKKILKLEERKNAGHAKYETKLKTLQDRLAAAAETKKDRIQNQIYRHISTWQAKELRYNTTIGEKQAVQQKTCFEDVPAKQAAVDGFKARCPL